MTIGPYIKNEAKPGISVIICCYNSAGKILPTLTHLATQQGLDDIKCEVILVDNNSVDDIIRIALHIWGELGEPFPLLGIKESRQGLSFARRCGVMTSQYENIVFCDDDNWLNPHYLVEGMKILLEQPKTGIVGGWSVATSDTVIPKDFHKSEYIFAVGKPHKHSKDITDGWQIWGAGMVARRSLLYRIFDDRYPFLCTDRIKGLLSSGGDDEICCRAILLGYRLYFSDNLNFTHFISSSRLSEQAIESLRNGFKESNLHLKRYQFCIQGLWAQQNKQITNGVVSLGKALWNYLGGNNLYARCHLDSFNFCFRLRNLCDPTSMVIYDFVAYNKLFA